MSAPNELEEILGSYGIVRRGKEPWVGVKNIESDTLFEDLENLLLRERLAEARWWNGNIDFVAWEARITTLEAELGKEAE